MNFTSGYIKTSLYKLWDTDWRILILPMAILWPAGLFCQDIPKSVSMRPFCPPVRQQFLATCFAYAPVYTAFSTMDNIRANITDSASKAANAFSDAYVFSNLNRSNRWVTRIFSRCGMNGTYLKSLEFLRVFGTCKMVDYNQEFSCQCVKNTNKLQSFTNDLPGKLVKISNYEIYINVFKYIDIPDGSTLNYTSKGWILQKLAENKVVIAAINQVSSLLALRQPVWEPTQEDFITLARDVLSNHVLCIIGYKFVKEKDNVNGHDREVLYLEIRNNYSPWGENGYAFVNADDFLPFVEDAAVIIYE